jgi:hypothetical protein
VTLENLRVIAADRGVVEDNLARGMTTHHHPFAEQLDQLSRTASLDDHQDGHD